MRGSNERVECDIISLLRSIRNVQCSNAARLKRICNICFEKPNIAKYFQTFVGQYEYSGYEITRAGIHFASARPVNNIMKWL